MSGDDTRITPISSPDARLPVPRESCLVQIHGPGLGKRYVLEREELTIGRDPRNNSVVVDLDNVSRRHARVSLRDGLHVVSDLGSTNGTWLNDREVREATPLRSGDKVQVGGSIFKFLCGGDVESLYHEEIYRLTIVDGL